MTPHTTHRPAAPRVARGFAPSASLPPRLPLTSTQRRIVIQRAKVGTWFTCAGCDELRPDALAAGRTGRDWWCEFCAHGAVMSGEAALPS